MAKTKFRDTISFVEAIAFMVSDSAYDTLMLSGKRQKKVEYGDITNEMNGYTTVRDMFNASDEQMAAELERIYKVKITHVPY